MTGSSVAGIITSIAASIAVLGGAWVTVDTRRSAGRRERADAERAAKIQAKLDAQDVAAAELAAQAGEIHKIVNQQHTDLTNYQAALVSFIKGKGFEVPVDQSAPRAEDSA